MKSLRHFAFRLLIGFAFIAILLLMIAYSGRAYMNRVGTAELDRVNARLDTEDPGWRRVSMETTRRTLAPPPEANSAPIILKVADLVSIERNKEWNTWRNSTEWGLLPLVPNLPSEPIQKAMLGQKAPTAEARHVARKLIAFPMGYHTYTPTNNPFMTTLPHIDKTRQVAALLDFDTKLLALENDPDAALASAHATLHVASSIGEEPFLVSQLVRMGVDSVSVQAASQVLAWGEPKKGLAELQVAYLKEADQPWILNGLRGERAALDLFFDGLESGKLSLQDLEFVGGQNTNPAKQAAFHLYKGLLPGDHAKALQVLTAYIAAMRRPHHEQVAALAEIGVPPGPPEDYRYIVTRLLLPACDRIVYTGLRVRTMLLAMTAAIACERFRQSNSRWPKTLAEIPKEILPSIPTDPYTGDPIRYTILGDGIAVYSVGDGDPNLARRQTESRDPLAGLGIGARLWSPSHRRQPPLPDAQNPMGGPHGP